MFKPDAATQYRDAQKNGHILQNFPLDPLFSQSSRFFQEDIIDAWKPHGFELLEAASRDGMTIPDEKADVEKMAQEYYQLTHSRPALIVNEAKTQTLLQMVEWRTATLIFPVYASSDEYRSVTLPLLQIEDMLLEQRQAAQWKLYHTPPVAPIQNMNPDEEDTKNTDPKNGLKYSPGPSFDLGEEQLKTALDSCAAFEAITNRTLPVRPESAGNYGVEILEMLDAHAFHRNADDCVVNSPRVSMVGATAHNSLVKIKYTPSLN